MNGNRLTDYFGEIVLLIFLLASLCGGIVLSIIFDGILGFYGVAIACSSAFVFGHLCGCIERSEHDDGLQANH